MLKIAWSELYQHPLPEGHRFPMEKYGLIPEQLLYEGTITQDNLYDPGFITEETVLLTHSEDYWKSLKHQLLSARQQRKMGFPLSRRLVKRALSIASGTIQNTDYAFKYGVSFNGAGGTHHSFRDRGEGFCLLNDIAIAANHLLKLGKIKKMLVVDLDVHQGNGTAEIFKNEDRVFTFSMHCDANYPLKKSSSDLDIGLAPFIEDDEYLYVLEEILPKLIQKEQPELIFYLSGVDILATDKLGKLNISIQACKERDRFVFDCCKENNIPVTVSLGGGYSPRIRDIVDAHCNTFRMANEVFF